MPGAFCPGMQGVVAVAMPLVQDPAIHLHAKLGYGTCQFCMCAAVPYLVQDGLDGLVGLADHLSSLLAQQPLRMVE
jgi:hypothetical protein